MKNPEVSKRFNYILNLRGLKAQELADKTGISKASISQYVNGSHCPSNDKAQMLSEVLRVNPLWLMGFEVPMENKKEINMQPKHIQKYAELISEYEKLNNSDKSLIDNMIKSLASKKE